MTPSDIRAGRNAVDWSEDPGPSWFVLGAWLSLTMIALGFVVRYGNRTPRWEDWFLVPAVTGKQPIDFSWLWEDVQGHRLPILKLAFIACYSVFGFNSKPILYLNVGLFSALALGLLWAIRRIRGCWHYADAFFPIVLLNLGQAEAFSWAQTFAYVSTTSLETLLLILIVTKQGAFSLSSLIAAGTCVLLLPLTYGGGLVFAAPMVLWLVYQGFGVERSTGPSRSWVRMITACVASVTAITIGAYFMGYRPLNSAPAELYVQPSARAYTLTAIKFLGAGFGGGASRPLWQIPALMITAIVLFAALCLVRQLVRRRLTGDPRAIGLGSYLISCLAVAWVVGIGRYAWGDTVIDSRYSATAVVAPIAAYFIFEFYCPKRLVPLSQILLFSAALSFFAANLQLGMRQGQMLRDAERAFLKDLHAAQPIDRLVARHSWVTYYHHQRLEEYLRQLRDADIPPYNRLPADSPFGVRALGPEPSGVSRIERDGQRGRVLGPDAYLRYDLKEPELVRGLRFRFSLVDPSGMLPAMAVRWASPNKPGFRHHNGHYESTTGEAAEIVVFIDEPISQVWILPNNRESTFEISGIELLLPD